MRIFNKACLLLTVGFLGACQVKDSKFSKSVLPLTHLEVIAPSVSPLKNKKIWVSLSKYLGRDKNNLEPPSEFILKSLSNSLILRDSSGVVHKGSEIKFGWRRVDLPKPINISRKVVGPFASFESAQLMANELKAIGFDPLIANPEEWEVWLANDSMLPSGIDFSLWNETITSKVHPVLKGSTGEILLKGPILIDAPNKLKWKGGKYQGPFRLQPDAYGSWTFVEEISLSRYLQGVVPYEIGPSAPEVALQAQAVLARTWAIANTHRFAIDGYHLCSDTQCQVYKDPSKASELIKDSIANTSGKVLTWAKNPIHAVYHASNGGVMSGGHEAWAILPRPYLRAQLDGSSALTDRFNIPFKTDEDVALFLGSVNGAYGQSHPRFRWNRVITNKRLLEALRFKAPDLIPTELKVLERGDSGRVLSFQIKGQNDQDALILYLDEIRRTLRFLPSTLFVVNQIDEGIWQFSGGGFGHGAGLSQAGAIELASKGWTLENILSYYYPGTIYGPLLDFEKDP